MKVSKSTLLAGKIALSGALLFLLYRTTPLEQILHVLADIQVAYVPIIFFILLVNTVLSAIKWRMLLQSDGLDIPLRKLVVSYLIGGFLNLFLPSNIGGDSYRIVDIMRKSREGVRSAASVFADRLSGFIALVCLSLLSSIIVAFTLNRPAFILLPLALLVFLGGVVYLLGQQDMLRWMLRRMGTERRPAINRMLDKFFNAFACYGASRIVLYKVMAISFCFQLLVIVAVYLMARALHVAVPFYYFSAFVPLITLMEALPFSIYGLGIRDAGYVFFFGWAGMGDLQTRSLALLFLAVTLSYSLIGGFLFIGRLLLAKGVEGGAVRGRE